MHDCCGREQSVALQPLQVSVRTRYLTYWGGGAVLAEYVYVVLFVLCTFVLFDSPIWGSSLVHVGTIWDL